jgi:RNA polymerase sigma-70 factor (ECF subfamily)
MTNESPAGSGTPPPPDGGADTQGQTTSLSLLERARAHDREAWSRLVHLYQPLVRRWCARAGLSAQDAEDVCQDVFGSAAAHFAAFRRDRPGDTFRGWLHVIARNAIRLHFRRTQDEARAAGGSDALDRLQEVPDPLAGIDPNDAAEVNDLHRRALEQVRPHFEESTWQAFWLSTIEGRSTAVLAGELGMTVAAIRQARSRVLRRLREELGEVLE